jgi:membrane protease YdiL (CAAX protease family)
MLPLSAEFAIVILGAFGWFFVGELIDFSRSYRPVGPSNAALEEIIWYELVAFVPLCVFLWARGWSFKRIGLHPNLIETLTGAGLALLAYAVAIPILLLIVAFTGDGALSSAGSSVMALGLNPITVVAVSVINPIFEETFVCGYAISALRDRAGPWTLISISVAIRLLYHVYLGPLGLLSIVPITVILTYWYARTGRLWPLIVAHVIWDFAALSLAG